MAKGGFLRRVGGIIRRIGAPERPTPSAPPGETNYQAWRRLKGQGSYRKQHALFLKELKKNDIDQDLTDDERKELWDSFVKNVAGKSTARRNSPNNPFWRESGIHPTNFDWRGFRVAMGYKRKGD